MDDRRGIGQAPGNRPGEQRSNRVDCRTNPTPREAGHHELVDDLLDVGPANVRELTSSEFGNDVQAQSALDVADGCRLVAASLLVESRRRWPGRSAARPPRPGCPPAAPGPRCAARQPCPVSRAAPRRAGRTSGMRAGACAPRPRPSRGSSARSGTAGRRAPGSPPGGGRRHQSIGCACQVRTTV